MKSIIKLLLLGTLLIFSMNGFAQTFGWAKSVGGASDDVARSVATDPLGNIYTVGKFQGTADFDPGPGVTNLVSNGNYDVFIQKLDPNGNFIWAKSVGDFGYDVAWSVTINPLGNIYMVGKFQGSVDFDPGPGITNLVSNGNDDIFIQKLDSNGNFIWAKSVGGSGIDLAYAMTIDPSGNVYTVGFFENTVDFDPGPGVTNLVSNGNYDVFIQKLDPNGNFIWAKSVGGSSDDLARSVTIDPLGNIYTVGKFRGTVDFDPGPGVTNLVSNGNDDAFIQKIDPNGNFIWTKSVGGSGVELALDITTDPLGDVYTVGFFENTVDFDPGPGVINLVSNGNNDAFIQKLDPNGNFIWAKSVGSSGFDEAWSVTIDPLGYIYTVGNFVYTVDFDPGPGINNLVYNGVNDAFIQKLDPNGSFIWAKSFGGTGSDAAWSVTIDPLGNIYTVGNFSLSVDFDPGPGITNLVSIGNNDVFTLILKQDSCSNFSLVVDSISRITCSDSGYVALHAQYGVEPYAYSWNTFPPKLDSLATFNQVGFYTLTVTDSNNCNKSTSLLINGPSLISGFDLNANLITTDFRPGFSATVWLDGFNNGCVAQSGQLILVLDNKVSYAGASIIPNLIQGDTLFWNFSNLDYDSPSIIPQIFLNTSASAAIGDTICFDVIITPIVGDNDTINNLKHYCFPIINGYDPNDKQVYPQGECVENYVLTNDRLTYTIRFQNTGNGDAINIHVIDSLSPYLDINSVSVIGQSHSSMYTEVLPGNVLNFVFDSIQLPDSTSNQIGSHGYVIFEVYQVNSLPHNTLIENFVDIYFDYNPKVVTNTIFNTIYDCSLYNQFVTLSNTVLCKNDSLNGYDGFIQDCNYYTWEIDGFYMGSDSLLNWVADTVGSFSLKVTSSNGICSLDSTINISVQNCVGIEKNISNNFYTLFPNPAINKLFISNEKDIKRIELLDITGRILSNEIEFSDGINIKNLIKGIYFLKLETKEGVLTKKFVKK